MSMNTGKEDHVSALLREMYWNFRCQMGTEVYEMTDDSGLFGLTVRASGLCSFTGATGIRIWLETPDDPLDYTDLVDYLVKAVPVSYKRLGFLILPAMVLDHLAVLKEVFAQNFGVQLQGLRKIVRFAPNGGYPGNVWIATWPDVGWHSSKSEWARLGREAESDGYRDYANHDYSYERSKSIFPYK